MRLLYVAIVAVVSVLASGDGMVATPDSTQMQGSKVTLHATRHEIIADQIQNDSGGHRFLRQAETPTKDDSTTNNEERAVTLPSTVTKAIKNEKFSTAITNLIKGKPDTKMTQAKLRVILLNSLPLDLRSKLLFVGGISPKVHWKLQGKITPYPSKISGPAAIALKAKMRYWLFYNIPPAYVFRKLNLVGKGVDFSKVYNGADEVLRAQPNYKFFKWYFDRWNKRQVNIDLVQRN